MPGSGLLFMANEAPKILSYYVPVSILASIPLREVILFSKKLVSY